MKLKVKFKQTAFFLLAFVIMFTSASFLFETQAEAAQITGINSGAVVHIRNMNSGTYIDVEGGVVQENRRTQLYTGNRSNSQKWKLVYLSNGYYVFRSMLNENYALSVENNYTSNWSKIVIKNIGSSNTSVPDYAQWLITETNGVYRVSSKASGNTKYLDCDNAKTENGTSIIQYTLSSTGERNFYWVFENDADISGNPWSYNALDNGNNLDWGGGTIYQAAFDKAVNVWNAYKPGVIRPDSIWIIQDVKITDVYKNNVTWAGLTSIVLGFGTIEFNKHYMDTYNDYQKQNVAIHELGHALGLDHAQVGNCVYEYVTEITTLGYSDKISYDNSLFFNSINE